MSTAIAANPFTERSRIVNAERFTGRWRELSLIFDAIDARRPVLVTGGPAIGKSSLLSHIVASAAIHLERPELPAYYLPLRADATPEEVYHTVLQALGEPGETSAALEVALIEIDTPVLLCLDDVHLAINAGWGARLLETLARIVRGGQLILVAALEGAPPAIGERFMLIRLGGFAPAEIRLFAESYLEETAIVFTPTELRLLGMLSAGHPAYLQRAAYHLFESRRNGGDWRASYLAEARERPIPGAPLPPGVFEGVTQAETGEASYATSQAEQSNAAPERFLLPEAPRFLLLCAAPMAALLFYIATGQLIGAIVIAITGCMAIALWLYRHRLS